MVGIMAGIKAGKFAVGKLDEAVSDPNDPEFQQRKADKKKIVGGRLRAVLVNTVKFLFAKVKGKPKEEVEAEAAEREAKVAAAAAAEDTTQPRVVAVAL